MAPWKAGNPEELAPEQTKIYTGVVNRRGPNNTPKAAPVKKPTKHEIDKKEELAKQELAKKNEKKPGKK